MQELTVILAAIVLAVAALGDIWNRVIPNQLCLIIAMIGIVRMVIAADAAAAVWTLMAAAIFLAIGFVLFSRKLFGGGDVKLLSAVVLLIGSRELPEFLLIMSFVGGLTALAVLAADHLQGSFVLRIHGMTSFWRVVLRIAASVEEALATVLPFLRRSLPELAQSRSVSNRPTVPYGVAIATAGIAILVSQFSLLR